MAAIPRFSHIVLKTNRMAEMRDWYCKVLGAHVVHEDPTLCFVTFDDEHHRLAFAAAPMELLEPGPMAIGLSHSAYTFPDLRTLLERYASLKDVGIVPKVPVQHGVTTSLYYSDPDGNLVELQIDNFASAEEATRYMHTGEFAADPVGPSFDPQAMLDALRSGKPVAELTTRSWALSGPELPSPLPRLMGLE